ncbi:hypothetical protein [Pelagibacterium lentulum]|uniref:Bacteriophage tail tape measure N-terminal domain-containing protein n=1 Tax=Pelagibacterium lentulum TaxID=2029865 RepID=A0A916R9Z1_9HYPH|nr:hypothetical protein [Pelagibacterium lentulum]GGA47266.1 hypothetical protein GCM10011499_16310 [Pelagibacterium lentulum]
MSSTDMERLVVQLDAKITGLQNGVNKAMGLTRNMSRNMERNNKQVATSFRNMASSIALVHGPLGGIASRFSATASIFSRTNLLMGATVIGIGGVTFAFTKMLGVAREAISEFDKLGKSARTVGLDTDLYQSLGFAALEEGVDGLDGALEQFTVRVGALRNGQGELATFLDKTNKSLLEQLQLATTQEERLRLIADAVANATSAEEKATIARAAFGRSGMDMVRILKDGADGLDDFTKRAREMGIVVDREVIARAEEMNNELGVANRIIRHDLMVAFVDLAPVVIEAARAIGTVARAIRDTVDAAKLMSGNLDLVGTDNLVARQRVLGQESIELGNQLEALQSRSQYMSGIAAEVHQASIDHIRAQLDANYAQQAEIEAILTGRRASITVTANPQDTQTTVPVGSGGSKSSAFMSAMEAISNRIDMIKAETEALREAGPLISEIQIPRRAAE